MKYIIWAIAALVAFYLLSQPENAARNVKAAFGSVVSAGNSLSEFVNELGAQR